MKESAGACFSLVSSLQSIRPVGSSVLTGTQASKQTESVSLSPAEGFRGVTWEAQLVGSDVALHLAGPSSPVCKLHSYSQFSPGHFSDIHY